MSDIINKEDETVTTEDTIEEVAGIRKMVVRNGKVVSKVTCPEGFEFDRKTKKCKKITAGEKITRKRASKKASRTRKRNAGINRIKGAKSRRRSLRIRKGRNVAAKASKIV